MPGDEPFPAFAPLERLGRWIRRRYARRDSPNPTAGSRWDGLNLEIADKPGGNGTFSSRSRGIALADLTLIRLQQTDVLLEELQEGLRHD